MSKEATKKFVENNGFICNNCGKIIVDGTKHKNEEDLCDQCKISDLEAKLSEREKIWSFECEQLSKDRLDVEHQLELTEAKLAESEKFMQANGFKNWEEAQDALNGKFECIFDEKHELWKKIVAENVQLKQQLAEKEEEYNDTCQHYEHQIAELGKEVDRLCKREKLLEKQLAENKEAIKYLKGIKRYDIGEMLTENTKLKQQLAEKEQQIETQKSNIEFLYDLFVSPQGEQTLKAINQDKISFAVEQLIEVQKYISDNAVYIDEEIFGREINDYIDNQIKQLKEGK